MISKISKVLLAAFCLGLALVCLSCLNNEFNNPVDPGVSIPPAGITGANALADTAIILSWSYDAALLSKTHFVIERKTAHIAFTQIGTTGNGKVQYTDKAAFSIDSTYFYRVRAFGDRNDGGYSNISGNLTISFNSPTGLTANPLADTAVQLTWQNTNTFGTGFEIERGTDGLTFALVKTVGAASVAAVIPGSYSKDSTYYFRLRAKSTNNKSAYSVLASSAVSFVAPVNLAATMQADTAVALTWQYGGTFAIEFIIEKSAGDMNHFNIVDSVSASQRSTVVGGAYSTDSTYYFRLRAKSGINLSAYSNKVSAAVAFDAPTALVAAMQADTAVALTWQYNGTFATKFVIQKSAGDTNHFRIMDSVVASQKSYLARGAYFTDTMYYFRVRAKSGINWSGYSNKTAAAVAFDAPKALVATMQADTAVALSWQYGGVLATKFVIEESAGDTNHFKFVDSVVASQKSYLARGAYFTDTTYYFRVGAKSGINWSAYSNKASAIVAFDAPAALTATMQADTAVVLSWQYGGTFATKFIIEKSAGDTNHFKFVDSIGVSETSYLIKCAYSTDTTYFFRVRGKSEVNWSRYSNNASAIVRFDAPTSVLAIMQADTAVSLSWFYYGTFATKFIIEKSAGDTSHFKVTDSTDASRTEYSVRGSYSADTTYYFRMRAKSAINWSMYSNKVSAVVVFYAPWSLIATMQADTAVALSWLYSGAFATKFIIEKSARDTNNFRFVDSVVASQTSYLAKGAYSTDTTYYFRVRATSGINRSRYSNNASAVVAIDAPTNLAAMMQADTAVALSWQYGGTFATKFIIEKSAGDMNHFNIVDSVGATQRSSVVGGAYSTDTTYYFRVRATSGINWSAYSNKASAIVVFYAPTSLIATMQADTAMMLSWKYGGTFATKFIIHESVGDTNHFVVVDSVDASLKSKLVGGAYSIDSIYYFQVNAISKYNKGLPVTSAPAAPSLPPPKYITIVDFTTSSLTLQWHPMAGYEKYFEIEDSIAGGNFTLIKTVPAGDSSIQIVGSFDSLTTYYFRMRAGSKYNVSGYSAIYVGSPSMPPGWVSVQGGTFEMGSTAGETDEQPVHAVTLNSFYMDKYEVTRARWREVVVWKQDTATSPLNPDPSDYKGNDTLPVEQVSWNDVQTWIGYLNEKEGTTKYRLPTEAEWEYAARGGVHWQDNYLYSGGNNLDSVAWHDPNPGGQTHVVGTKAPNQLGIYDMSGNVWEWCLDWYGTYSNAAQTNPTGPATGSYRVLRGGSCFAGLDGCRVSNRDYNNPSPGSTTIGFRCVRDL